MPSKREIIKYLEHFRNRAKRPEGLFACLNCPLYSGNFIPDFFEHDQENASYFDDLKCSKRLELIYRFLGKEKNFSGSCFYLQNHVNELIKEAHDMHNKRLNNE